MSYNMSNLKGSFKASVFFFFGLVSYSLLAAEATFHSPNFPLYLVIAFSDSYLKIIHNFDKFVMIVCVTES